MRDFKVRDIKKIIIFGFIGLVVLVTIFSSFQTIRSGEVGLKVRFGKIVSTQLNEGFNLKIPYIEDIVVVNIKVQKIELITES
jgi:regulator of protease activity HflC (stomatin/prohibitin superfamily)